jgi:hypothetical protein
MTPSSVRKVVKVSSAMRSSCLARCQIITFPSRVVDSFQQVEKDLYRVRQWLKRETRVEVKTEALLSELRKRLENSGHISHALPTE